MDRNKPLFTLKQQNEVIVKYNDLIEPFLKVSTIEQWNQLRDVLNQRFPGTMSERLILFGYIDGQLQTQLPKPLKSERCTMNESSEK